MIVSQYFSLCVKCRGLVKPGEVIHWERGEQGAHAKCPDTARGDLLHYLARTGEGKPEPLPVLPSTPREVLAMADRMFRFLAGLNMQDHPVVPREGAEEDGDRATVILIT